MYVCTFSPSALSLRSMERSCRPDRPSQTISSTCFGLFVWRGVVGLFRFEGEWTGPCSLCFGAYINMH